MESARLKYLPNALTFCNMTIGILVICFMVHSPSVSGMKLACYLIYIAVVIDMLDGFLARYLNASSEMGKQLDSFADFVTFGIAPVVIFISNMNPVPWYILIVLIFYPLTGAFRLARYNLQGHCEYFIGLPTTASSFIMITVLLVNSYLHKEYTTQFIVFYLLLAMALSVLMVSSFRVKRILKFKDLSTGNSNLNDVTSFNNKSV